MDQDQRTPLRIDRDLVAHIHLVDRDRADWRIGRQCRQRVGTDIATADKEATLFRDG
jgi:hypothetical protein